MRAALVVLACCGCCLAQAPRPDPRNIATGHVIPAEGYADQPYVVKTDDGHWLAVLTTGQGAEGTAGQHIISLRSADFGKTWSAAVDIEPAAGPEASWAMPLKTPAGRVYAFYTYNQGNVREVPGAESPGISRRVDTLGVYAFRCSDDHGMSWSRERYEIPMRTAPLDLDNNFGGRTLLFWGVGKPMIHAGAAYFGFAKVFRWGVPGTLVRSRGFLYRSDNILTERDPAKIRWVMLPDSGDGLRAPKGPIAEETNLTALSDGALYAVYRTIDGYICHAYSRDRGHTWTAPEYATYSPGGRRIKNPRAFSFVRKLANGKYLLWYHNHGGEAVHLREKWDYYRERNPGWIAGGIERGGRIHWSEPEILLYDDDPATRISYPDFIEDGGRFFVTETQKSVARVHEIDRGLLEGLWAQFDRQEVAREGLALEVAEIRQGMVIDMPRVPDLSGRGGLAIDFWLKLNELTPDQILLDSRGHTGKGLLISTGNRFNLKLTLSDGFEQSTWESDPGTHPGTLGVDRWQHVAVIADAGPRIILCVIDGVLDDGGPVRQFGWGRFPPSLGDVNGREQAAVAHNLRGEMKRLRIYRRPLRVSEAVGNFRAGFGQ